MLINQNSKKSYHRSTPFGGAGQYPAPPAAISSNDYRVITNRLVSTIRSSITKL